MIKWGIIGAGNIANRFAESLAQVEGATLYAVANRTVEKAEAFQAQHPCAKAYGDYQTLLDDKEVDAVYIALPHKYHLEWVLKAIEAGKGILCEKPATMNEKENRMIQDKLADQPVFFMEAMKNRFTPAYEEVKDRIEAGEIGQITKVTTSLCRVFDEVQASYHFQPGQGGCLLDMGIYNASLLHGFLPGDYELVDLDYEIHPNQVETYVNATFKVNGAEAILESAFDRATETKAVITGAKGEIVLYDFHRPTKFDITVEGETERIEKPYVVDDFYGEISHVVTHLQEGKLESDRMPVSETIALAKIIDTIKATIFK